MSKTSLGNEKISIPSVPKLLNVLQCESKLKTAKKQRVVAHSLACTLWGGRGVCWNFKMELGRVTSINYSHGPAQNQTQGGQCIIGALLVLGRATGNSDSQDSPRLRLGGSHHLPPYSILCASPRGPHPNGIWSRDSQLRVPKLPKLGLSQRWGPITSHADF